MKVTGSTIKTYLGDKTPLDGVDFSQQLWVKVEQKRKDGSYKVVGAMVRLGVVPYALWGGSGVGQQGPKGDKGDKGDRGETGPPGTVSQEVLDVICRVAISSNYQPCPNFCNCTNIVFVSSEAYTGDMASGEYPGNMRGLAGADAKCQALATAAGLGGTFRAWLSVGDTVSTSGPVNRFVHSVYPYVRVDGVVIANNWDDLVDGPLNTLILTEQGTVPNGDMMVRTGTAHDGNPAPIDLIPPISGGDYCSDWQSRWDPARSAVGYATGTLPGYGWSYETSAPCSLLLPIYCFQQ
jgi:hypothetical protein